MKTFVGSLLGGVAAIAIIIFSSSVEDKIAAFFALSFIFVIGFSIFALSFTE